MTEAPRVIPPEIKSEMRDEGKALNRIRMEYHSDLKGTNNTPEFKESTESMIRILNALGDIHKSNTSIKRGGWPKRTTLPNEVTFFSLKGKEPVAVRHTGIDKDKLKPIDFFDALKEFHANPEKYKFEAEEKQRMKSSASARPNTSGRPTTESHSTHRTSEQSRAEAEARAAAAADAEKKYRAQKDKEKAEADKKTAEERAAREKAEQDRRDAAAKAQKDAHEKAEQTKREENERAEQKLREQKKEIVNLLTLLSSKYFVFSDDIHVSDDASFAALAEQSIKNIKNALAVFDLVGSPMALLRGYHFSTWPSDQTWVIPDSKLIYISSQQDPRFSAHIILANVQLMQSKKTLLEDLEKEKNLKFEGTYFIELREHQPTKLRGLLQRISEAYAETDQKWLLQSPLVAETRVQVSQNKNEASYSFSPARSIQAGSKILFTFGIDVTPQAVQNTVNEATRALEFATADALIAPLKIPALLDTLSTKYRISFVRNAPGNQEIISPINQLRFYQEFQSAYENIPPKNRIWINNLQVAFPIPEFGFLKGMFSGHKAKVVRNQLSSLYNAGIFEIQAALEREIKKRKEKE